MVFDKPYPKNKMIHDKPILSSLTDLSFKAFLLQTLLIMDF